MSNERSGKLKVTLAAGFFAVAVAATAITVGALSGNANRGMATSPEDLMAASEVVSKLGTPQAPSDRADEALIEYAPNVGEGGLDLSTVRQLGESHGYLFWSGTDVAGNICLLTEFPSGVTVGSCSEVSQFKQTGASFYLEIADTKEFAEAYLLPDEVVRAGASFDSDLSTEIDGLLYTLSKDASRAGDLNRVVTKTGSEFTLSRLDHTN